MLDWLERIALGVVALALVLMVAVYFAIGLRSTTPAAAVGSERVSQEKFEQGLTAEKKKAIEDAERKAAARATPAPSGSAPRPAAPAKKQYFLVTPEVKDRLGTLNDAVREVGKAKSQIIKNPDGSIKGLQIYEFDGDFLGAKLGLEENDVILAVDGTPLPTDPVEARALYLEYKSKLSAQQPILVDVERRGQVTRITFDIR